MVSSSRTNKDQTRRKSSLLSYQQHDPSTCKFGYSRALGHIPELSEASIDTNSGSDSVMWEWDLTGCWWGGPTLVPCVRLFKSRQLQSATWSSQYSRHNWYMPLDKIFRTSEVGIDSLWWFMSQITMSWGDLPSWAKPSALFPQLRICTLTKGNNHMS